MKWITRQRIQVNRSATCWLIRRFLDTEPEFLFVPAEEVASVQAEQGAIGLMRLALPTLTRTLRAFVRLRHLFTSGWRMILC